MTADGAPPAVEEREASFSLHAEYRRLRRTIDDLAVFGTLSSAWAGFGPKQTARSLADLLLDVLSLDLVYVRISRNSGDEPVDASASEGAIGLEALRNALAPLLETGRSAVLTAEVPGSGKLQVVVKRFDTGDMARA